MTHPVYIYEDEKGNLLKLHVRLLFLPDVTNR